MSQVHDQFEDFEGPVRFRGSIEGPLLNSFGGVTFITSATTAEVIAGKVLLPAITGYRYRVLDWKVAARGGAASGATSVDITDTATSPVSVAAVAAAALTEDAVVAPNSANVTNGAGGMAAGLTAAKGVQIIKNGSDLATATSVDVTITYALERV